MKKAAPYLYSFVFAAALAGLCYFLSENLPMSLSLFALALFAVAFLVVPMLQRKQVKERKRKECFRFVSSFIVSLSLTGSLDKSFEGAASDAQGEFKEVLSGIEDFDVKGRIQYLDSYFESESYSMFLSLYGLYEEQGGDLLDLSRELMDELTRIEESADAMEKNGYMNLREFIMTWILSLGVVGFLRFGLANFYESLVKNALYLGALAVFFAFFLFAICFYFHTYAGKPSLSSLYPKKSKEDSREKD